MRRLAIVAILGFVFLSEASAGPMRLLGVTSASRPTAQAVLADAGCHPLWLSKALSDSDLSAEKLGRLPRGQRIMLAEERCAPAPPEKVAAESKKILATLLPRKEAPKAAAAAPPQPQRRTPEAGPRVSPTPTPPQQAERLATTGESGKEEAPPPPASFRERIRNMPRSAIAIYSVLALVFVVLVVAIARNLRKPAPAKGGLLSSDTIRKGA